MQQSELKPQGFVSLAKGHFFFFFVRNTVKMSMLPNNKELNHSLRLILSMGCSRSLLRLFQVTFPSGSISGDSPGGEWCLADMAAGCP